MRYDVIIIGAGPAGIFAALELAKAQNVRTIIIDRGPDIDQRDRKNSLLSGWGGAGAFSDGKLTLSPEVGGQLNTLLPEPELRELLRDVDRMWLEYSGPLKVYGVDQDAVANIEHRAQLAGLKLIHSEVRHLGTEMCPLVLTRMRDALRGKVDVRTDTGVEHLLVTTRSSPIPPKRGKQNSSPLAKEKKIEVEHTIRRVCGVETTSGEIIEADYVIAAPGRVGSDWLSREAERLELKMATNPVDIGVRVEVPAAVMQELTDAVYEPKLVYYSKSFDDKVRSFCVCPNGEVVAEKHNGVVSVNGHSYAKKKTRNTNFALLVSTSFTEPFHEPITYGRYVASLANLLSGGVIVQRLGDLESGRRSTAARIERGLMIPTFPEAVPGDLSFVLPYRHLSGILEMLHAMDTLAPGVASRNTLLYGVEVKFYSSRIQLSDRLETEVKNLFAIGDGAGVTRGLVQSSASGVIAAREILRRIGGS
ncbi:MAG: FAD-dependent oxidoreductase [Armatimonadetes bacterium]|nr:FAD-dependent oxidoreductase [Armatimonadota bacterium]